MQRSKRLASSVLLAVVATVCVAYTAQQQRSVVLEIGLPNGAAPQLRIADGGTGTVSLPSGSYGFVPTLDGGGATVTVEMWDLNRTPNKEMASVKVPVGGTAVRSQTDPQFIVRVVRVDVK